MAAATALDLNHTSGITGASTRCIGGETLDMVAGAEVVVVTAGRARSPGMTRADLIDVNARVIRQAGEAIRSEAPNAVVIVVTNPLDEMTAEMLRATGFPRERVLGMAGTLDSSRFRHALALAAGVSPADVQAITLGSHGEEMAPIPSRATIKGRPLGVFLSEPQIDACVQDAITGGGQVVALKKSGSATIAPAHATIELIDHMRGARTGPVPVSVMLDGEYGIDGVVLGVPAHLGQGGLIKVEELRITDQEQAALEAAAEAIRARLGL
jgi:malate dehydrogenase